MVYQSTFTVSTPGRGSYSITGEVRRHVQESGVQTGICQVFVHHTSASLMLCENADPEVREDLERFMAELVPDGDPMFQHIDEGTDDMPAHVRSVLTSNPVSIPVTAASPGLGTWQGIYLWEHRQMPHQRRVTVTLLGE